MPKFVEGLADRLKVPAGARDVQVFDDELPGFGNAKDIAHAPQPTVWSTDKDRKLVPVAGNAERPLPDARRNIAGRSEG